MTTIIEQQICADIASYLHLDIKELNEQADLVLDYHLDSLDIFRLLISLERKYGIRFDMMKSHGLTSVPIIIQETLELVEQNA